MAPHDFDRVPIKRASNQNVAECPLASREGWGDQAKWRTADRCVTDGYFRILATAGATNLLLVTLLMPVIALLLGTFVLGERLAPRHLGGMALIAAGLAVIDESDCHRTEDSSFTHDPGDRRGAWDRGDRGAHRPAC